MRPELKRAYERELLEQIEFNPWFISENKKALRPARPKVVLKARRSVAPKAKEGRVEGRAEGEAKGRAEMIAELTKAESCRA